jgi:hypothetical protein
MKKTFTSYRRTGNATPVAEGSKLTVTQVLANHERLHIGGSQVARRQRLHIRLLWATIIVLEIVHYFI